MLFSILLIFVSYNLCFMVCFFVSLREKELEARQGGMENLEGVGDGKNMTETYSTFIRLNKTEKTIKFLKIMIGN